MRLVIAEPAERDLGSIIDYIARDNPVSAEGVFRAIVATARTLAEAPGIGRPGRLSGTREFPVTALPYLIVYEVGDGVVTILAVFHGARDLARAIAERGSELNR